jgi:hypothetical protein
MGSSKSIGPGGLLLVIPHPICCPNFNFMGGVGKKKKKKSK